MIRTVRIAVALLLLATPSFAAPVFWTEWKTKAAGTMTGVIALACRSKPWTSPTPATTTLGISTLAGGSPDYWALGPDSTYESATVDNRPPNFGIVTIGATTLSHTITFSRPISDAAMMGG